MTAWGKKSKKKHLEPEKSAARPISMAIKLILKERSKVAHRYDAAGSTDATAAITTEVPNEKAIARADAAAIAAVLVASAPGPLISASFL